MPSCTGQYVIRQEPIRGTAITAQSGRRWAYLLCKQIYSPAVHPKCTPHGTGDGVDPLAHTVARGGDGTADAINHSSCLQ